MHFQTKRKQDSWTLSAVRPCRITVLSTSMEAFNKISSNPVWQNFWIFWLDKMRKRETFGRFVFVSYFNDVIVPRSSNENDQQIFRKIISHWASRQVRQVKSKSLYLHFLFNDILKKSVCSSCRMHLRWKWQCSWYHKSYFIQTLANSLGKLLCFLHSYIDVDIIIKIFIFTLHFPTKNCSDASEPSLKTSSLGHYHYCHNCLFNF